MKSFFARSVRGESRRDLIFDGAAVAITAILSLAMVLGPDAPLKWVHGFTGAVLIVGTLILALRRRHPVLVGWVSVAIALLLPLGEELETGLLVRADGTALWWWPPAAPFVAYSLMAYGRRMATALPPAVALAVSVAYAPESSDVTEAGPRSMVFVVIAALVGLYAAARRRLFHALVERAERAEREQYLLADRARADERTRLAAEMHDIVTHRVSLMVVQAGALRISSPDAAARLAAEELRATGCQALEELRDLVGLLRNTPGDRQAAEPVYTAEQPPPPRIESLVEESRAVGVDVALELRGDAGLVSPVVGRTTYRIVQEALTNVRKHAPGASVRVDVRYGANGVHVSVSNTVPTHEVDQRLASAGSGTGLLGLRQRVEMVSGTLSAVPDEEGGFRLDASLPAYVATADTLESTV